MTTESGHENQPTDLEQRIKQLEKRVAKLEEYDECSALSDTLAGLTHEEPPCPSKATSTISSPGHDDSPAAE